MKLRRTVKVRTEKRPRGFRNWALLLVIIIGIALYSLSPFTPWAQASALSFVCASSAAATSTAACAGEQAGDLLVVAAYDSGSGTVPTTPAGFTSIDNVSQGTGSPSGRAALGAGWSTAASTTSGSGTWTNANDVAMMVYRGQNASPIGNDTTSNVNTSSIPYAADALTATDGSSWFAAFGARNTGDAGMATAPTGMTNRTSSPATPVIAGHDTNGPTGSSYAGGTVSGFGSSTRGLSIVIELKAAPTITVSSSGSLVPYLSANTTQDFAGGAFTLIRDVGTASVTSIKVHNSGSINAQTDLVNMIIYYKQEAACETTLPGSAIQFNSTPGSFNASGDSTVTGAISVSTSQVCVYVTLDVGAGASPAQTIILQITNPSTDLIVSTGTVGPASNVAIAGSIKVAPTTDIELGGGEWFGSGAKQPFYWAR